MYRVSTADNETGLESSVAPPRSTRHRKVLLMVKDVVLVTLVVLGMISMGFNLQYRRQIDATKDIAGYAVPRKSCYCGRTTEEAKAMGCKYSSLNAAWLPEHCRDDELTAEFEQSGDGPDGQWLYWADKARTQPLSVDQVAELANDPRAIFYMSGHWHVIHCLFFWRMEHRSRFNGKFVEGRSDTEKHILHCMQVIANPQIGVGAGVSLNADVSGGFE